MPRSKPSLVRTVIATASVGACTVACGLLTGVDFDRVVVDADGGGGTSGGTGASGASGNGTSGNGTSGNGTSGNGTSSGTSGIPGADGGDGLCTMTGAVSPLGHVCTSDGTWKPKCQDASCSGFGLCLTDPHNQFFNNCVPPLGSVVTSCAAASSLTTKTTPDPGGPIIWGAQFVYQSNDCGADQRTYFLSFSYFDAEGDAPASPYEGMVLDADFGFGTPMPLLGTAVTVQGKSSGSAIAYVCVNANPLPPSAAVVLVDLAGHHSNPLCLKP
jgi:hypothetical protein